MKQKPKKTDSVLACLLSLCLLLTGCSRAPDVSGRAIVSAVAVGVGDGELTVTVEFLEKVGADEIQRYGSSQAVGVTFADAVSAIEREIGHTLYLDNCQLILVGGVEDRASLLSILLALDADRRVRPLTLVAVAAGDAGKLITEKKDEETSTGQKFRELLSSIKIANRTLKDSINLLSTTGRGIIFPLVDQQESHTIVGYTALDGTGRFWEEDIAKRIPLLGSAGGPVTVTGEGGAYDLLLEGQRMWVTCGMQDGQPFFIMNVSMEANLISHSDKTARGSEVIKNAEKALERLGLNDYRYVFHEFYKKSGIDYFSLGKRFSLRHPRLWNNFFNDWENHIKNLQCEIVVTAKIQDQRGIVDRRGV